MFKKTIKVIKFLVGWPLSIVALIFLWRIFTPQLNLIKENITHANWLTLFLALIAFELYFLLRVILWHTILKDKGHNLPLKDTAWGWSIAEINRYIPGNVWSIVGRGATFAKFKINQSTLIVAWGQESIITLLGSSLLGILSLGFAFYHFLPDFFLKGTLYWFCIVGILAVNIIWIFHKNIKILGFLPHKLQKYFVKKEHAFAEILLSLFAFFFFGLGTYLSIHSLFDLPLGEVTFFISLFSLSYTIGYLSLITPMGLGVREIVISQGLLSYLGKSIVGFVAIFARFFLLISELIFLFLSFIWHKEIVAIPQKITSHLQKYKYEYLVLAGSIAYLVYFTAASFYRYTNFFTGRFDLGNMDQTVWNSLHGHIFELTDPNGTNIMSRLGTHADFILVLLAPFYLLWEDPRMLLLIQTILLALGAIFVFLIAKESLKNKSLAIIFAFAYLLNPSVEYTNLYDFHPVTLATTLFLGAWYFLKKKKYIWTLVFLVLAGLTKEEAWLVVGLFGLYFGIFEKKKILGFFVSLFSFTMFYLLVWKFIPMARGGQHFALSYYSDFGSTPGGILKNIFLSPLKTFSEIFGKAQLLYLLELFLPLGFLSLLSTPILIFAGPDLGINLLSTNSQLHQINFQYTAVITPFIFIAAIISVRFLMKRFKFVTQNILIFYLVAATVIGAYLYGPLPGALRPTIDMFVKQESDRSIIENFLKDIPSGFSVAATNNIGSHLSHRQKIYTIPVGIDKADVVVFLLNDEFAQPSLAAQKTMAENMKHDKNYIEVFKENDFVVFEKRDLYSKKEPTLQKDKLYPASIEALQHRDFEGGQIQIQKTINSRDGVTTMLFSYPSDGLTLYGRVDIPDNLNSQQKLPVVIINRGYLTSSAFNEETSYLNISQAFAKNGFMAITPDYRNNGESDTDRSIVGILGYPIDVLNLISSLPTFPQADSQHIFMWGYSVGGQVVLSTLASYDQNATMKAKIQAASVWAPVIDPYQAYLQFHELFPDEVTPYKRVFAAFGPIQKNPAAWQSISPLFYMDDVTTSVRVVHGLSDDIAPYQWSIELFNVLKSFHNNAQISLYKDTDHNFTGTWRSAVIEDIAYFKTFL